MKAVLVDEVAKKLYVGEADEPKLSDEDLLNVKHTGPDGDAHSGPFFI